MIKRKKVGGIYFLRVGRLQFMFCLCRKKKVIKRRAPLPPIYADYDFGTMVVGRDR